MSTGLYIYQLFVCFVRTEGWEGNRGINDVCFLYKNPKVQISEENENDAPSHHPEITAAGILCKFSGAFFF